MMETMVSTASSCAVTARMLESNLVSAAVLRASACIYSLPFNLNIDITSRHAYIA